MVSAIYDAERDRAWLQTAFPALETEYGYWTSAPKQVCVRAAWQQRGATHKLARYYADTDQPRPEGFRSVHCVTAFAGQQPAQILHITPELITAQWHLVSVVLVTFHQRHKAACQQPDCVMLHRKDVDAACGLSDTDAKTKYREIASTAESGWDFSSRWGSRTTHVIPTDLNSFLLMMEENMQHFAQAGHPVLHVMCMP